MEFPRLKLDWASLRKECGDPSDCAHSETELRKKRDKLGKARLHFQCVRCGQPVGNRVSAKQYSSENLSEIPDFDLELSSRLWREFNARLKAREVKEKERLKKLFDECYEKYLRSDEWKERRELVLLRAQGICEGCRRRRASEVHHTTYENVGEEFLFQLVALCRSCHDRLHARLLPRFLETLHYLGYARGYEDG